MRPANSTNFPLVPLQPGRDQAQPDQDWPDDEGERRSEQESGNPHVGPGDLGEVDGESEDEESDDLGETGERRVESFDVGLMRCALVAQHDPGNEDCEETRSVGESGDAEQHQRAGQGPQGIEALAGQWHLAHKPQQRTTTDDADCRADAHLQQEIATDVSERAPAEPTGGDQAGHQGDPDRVVRAGLAFEDGAAGAGDLAPPKHGEHHRRIGRGHCRGHEQRDVPGQTERQVHEHRAGSHGYERANNADHGDGCGRRLEPGPADVHAPVEQDAKEGNGDHSLHRPRVGGVCNAGMTLTATAAPTRNNAGDGIATRSVKRFDNTATSPTPAVTSTRRANGSVSVTAVLPGGVVGYVIADQTSRRTTTDPSRCWEAARRLDRDHIKDRSPKERQ